MLRRGSSSCSTSGIPRVIIVIRNAPSSWSLDSHKKCQLCKRPSNDYSCTVWVQLSLLCLRKMFFIRLPDPKGHVVYCHHLAPVVVRIVICKLLHFNLLLWNHWTNWSHTWYEFLLDSSLQSSWVCFVDEKHTKETRGLNVSKWCVHIIRIFLQWIPYENSFHIHSYHYYVTFTGFFFT